jgi:thiol-disulfide isomerase/thioredoxin
MSRTQQKKPPAHSRNTKKPPYLWIGIGVVGLLALAVAALLSGGGAPDPGMPAAASVDISGTALPAFAGDPNNDPAVGMTAPDATGRDFAGASTEITDDGRPKVNLFLAHWCPHCQREVPVVQAYQNDVGFPGGVDLYAVATAYSDTRPNWPPSAWLAREGWTFPTLVDDDQSSALGAFGQGAFPYYVLIDSDGNVAMRLSGEQDPTNLASLMERLAAE